MYEAFYGLEERPFNLTPDPRYLFLSEKHKEAFAHLLYGIKNRSGFVMVSGEIGTGKTTICRTLLGQLDDDTEVAFIFNPFLSPVELLRKINEDFGIPSQAKTTKGLIDELNAYLLDCAAKDKNCVLVIDEAQNLEPRVLEQVRLLSNLETETQKLLQIVLIGQPELAHHLALPELRQLNQRITARYHLKPLDQQETLQYIAYRLRIAGGRRKVTFSRAAVKAVHRYSGGTPRVINALCDRALLIGYTRERREIATDTVRQAYKEVRGEQLTPPKAPGQRRFSWRPAAAAALLLLGAGAIFYAGTAWAPAPGGGEQTAQNEPDEVNREAQEQSPVELSAFQPDPLTLTGGPGTADAAIDALDPDVARNAAAAGLLRKWNAALIGGYPKDASADSLGAFAEANGLAHEILSPSLEQLININLPAFVLVTSNHDLFWVGLLGIDGGDAIIAASPGRTVNVPLDDFDARYMGRAVVVWRDPEPERPVLTGNTRGAAVRTLQENLKSLGWLDEATGVYDADTREAVRQLQRETGLTVDGLTGQQTRMVLTSWFGAKETPALTRPKDGAFEALVAALPNADLEVLAAVNGRNRDETADAGGADEPETAEPEATSAEDEAEAAEKELADARADEEPEQDLAEADVEEEPAQEPADADVEEEPAQEPAEADVAEAPAQELAEADVEEEPAQEPAEADVEEEPEADEPAEEAGGAVETLAEAGETEPATESVPEQSGQPTEGQEAAPDPPEAPRSPARPQTPLTPQWPSESNIAFPFTGGPTAPTPPERPDAQAEPGDSPDTPAPPSRPEAPAPAQPQRPDTMRVEELPPPEPETSPSNRLEPRPEAGEREVTDPAQSARVLAPRERSSDGDEAEEDSES